MRIGALRAMNRWPKFALVVVLSGLATWLLVQVLRKHSTSFEWRLWALLVTLAALCLGAWRCRADPVRIRGGNVWVFPVLCSVVALVMSIAGFNGSSSAELFSAV